MMETKREWVIQTQISERRADKGWAPWTFPYPYETDLANLLAEVNRLRDYYADSKDTRDFRLIVRTVYTHEHVIG